MHVTKMASFLFSALRQVKILKPPPGSLVLTPSSRLFQLFMSDKNIAWNGIAVKKWLKNLGLFISTGRFFFPPLLLLAAAGRLAIRQLRWMILEGEVDVIPSIFDGSISLDLRCEVSKHHSYSYLLEKWYLQYDLNGWIRIKHHLENKDIQYF